MKPSNHEVRQEMPKTIRPKQTVTDGAKGNSSPKDQPDNKGKVVSLPEACDRMGIAKPTMYKYLKEGAFELYRDEGIIPAFKYEGSRVWKFDLDQLDTWLTKQRERGRS